MTKSESLLSGSTISPKGASQCRAKLGRTCRQALVVLICFLFAAGASRASDDDALVIVHRTADTNKVLPLVKVGLGNIPSSIKTALFSAGYKIIITPTMAYGKTNADMERRSDYDISNSYNAAGVFRPDDHAIYIPERCSWGNDVPRLQNSPDLVGVFRHEFGHAYDCYLNYPSGELGTTAFEQAYTKDSAKLTNTQRRNFSYFVMQDRKTSQTELFAELFGIITCGDDSTLRSYDRDLYGSFPNCVQTILSLNPYLKAHSFAGSLPVETSQAGHNTVQTTSTTASAFRPSSASSFGQEAKPANMPQAMQAYQSGDYITAERMLVVITSQDPSNAQAFYLLGNCRLGLRQPAQARDAYLRCLSLKPSKQLQSYCRQGLARTEASK